MCVGHITRSSGPDRMRMTSGLWISVVLVSSMTSVGCGNEASDKTRAMVEAAPVRVEAEQVVLTAGEVDCGSRADLWGPASAPNQGRSFCPLTPAGRALKFDDDVVVTDPGYRFSYVQVRGTFPLSVLEIVNTKDEGENTKLVELRVGIKVDNACFPNPLPIMGSRKGQFTQDYPPLMLFRLDGAWQMEKFVH